MNIDDLQADLMIAEQWNGGESEAQVEVNGIKYHIEAVRHNDDGAMVIEAVDPIDT